MWTGGKIWGSEESAIDLSMLLLNDLFWSVYSLNFVIEIKIYKIGAERVLAAGLVPAVTPVYISADEARNIANQNRFEG